MDSTENIITIPGQENTPLAALTPMQEALNPFVPGVLVFWWGVWIAMFGYMFTRYIVLPIVKGNR